MRPDDKITDAQQRGIAALLSEPNRDAAALKAGVHVSTLFRWLKQPHFLAAYRGQRRLLIEQAVGQLQNTVGEAVEALRRNLTCGAPAGEIKAAVAVIQHAFQGVELLDLADRLAALENPNEDNEPDQEQDDDEQPDSAASGTA